MRKVTLGGFTIKRRGQKNTELLSQRTTGPGGIQSTTLLFFPTEHDALAYLKCGEARKDIRSRDYETVPMEAIVG